MLASRSLSAGRCNLSFHRPPSGLALYPQLISSGGLPGHSSDSSQCLKRKQLRAPKAPCEGSPLQSVCVRVTSSPVLNLRAAREPRGSSVSPPLQRLQNRARRRAATRLRRRVASRRCSARDHTHPRVAAGLQVRSPAPCFTQLPARPYTPTAGAGSTSARSLRVPFHTRGRGREQARPCLLTAAAPVVTPFPNRRKTVQGRLLIKRSRLAPACTVNCGNKWINGPGPGRASHSDGHLARQSGHASQKGAHLPVH
ncbi:hypothetical protein NDU88_007001 [Pleurodeles waltl]|uniref:Uncharacterized protein n=1 Tax=Pleurodeles waltl TaxID=8319 RepID=A0AAV7U272_PLEWA|nr:hypothetical protein NDU88_007001 [Pleurodeles waltl]